jgi:cellulose synthase/poly-beta-1,6-N-acetylglucosamine synthase-like glycosyltransferase
LAAGSTFRRALAVEIGSYDTDTMTEDIDFTLKMIRDDNRSRRIIYAPSVVTRTEAVLTFSQLIRQRFRWKYGRLQTFLKNNHLFFSTSSNHDRRLTWLNLPFALYSEIAFLLEPLMLIFIVYTSIHYNNPWAFISAYAVMTSYIALNVIGEYTNPVSMRLKLLALTPFVYPLLLVVAAAEYCASLQTIVKLRDLLARRPTGAHWQHVTRAGEKI